MMLLEVGWLVNVNREPVDDKVGVAVMDRVNVFRCWRSLNLLGIAWDLRHDGLFSSAVCVGEKNVCVIMSCGRPKNILSNAGAQTPTHNFIFVASSSEDTTMAGSYREEKFECLSPRSHVLRRSDMYVGSLEPTDMDTHIFDRRLGEDGNPVTGKRLNDMYTLRWGTLRVSPAFDAVVREITVNAFDRERDPTLTRIDVKFDKETGRITVKNNGRSIPVRETTVTIDGKEQTIWLPTMVFGRFRSGSNFDDTGDDAGSASVTSKRYTGGRNGYGAKLTNTFSKEFSVEALDTSTADKTGVSWHFTQTFRDNMKVEGAPKVKQRKPKKAPKSFTQISFIPDYARFGMGDGMTEDALTLLRTRLVEAAACLRKRVSLYYNGEKLPATGFSQLAELFLPPIEEGASRAKVPSDMVTLPSGEAVFEVCAVPRPPNCTTDTVGFVNMLHCSRGKHADYAHKQCAAALAAYIRKTFKRKDLAIRSSMIKRNVLLLVKALVPEPAFASQTKEELATPVRKFGFTWTPEPRFIRALANTGITDSIYAEATHKETRSLTSAAGVTRKARHVVVDKYEPATTAHKANSNCSLFVCEGDSAKAAVVAGMSVVGRSNYGVFPLRGKLKNVRGCSAQQLLKVKEVTDLMKILGLTFGKTYTSLRGLRYKKLVIFADQDLDGAHIAGLIMNFIHALFPSVLACDPNYVQRFATPIVRASKRGQRKDFFTQQAFHEWAGTQGTALSTWACKYYKGLGTSTSKEAREYFKDMGNYIINLHHTGAPSDKSMEMLFTQTKEGAAGRKDALHASNYDAQAAVDYAQSSVSYEDFVKKEVLHFSNYDNVRSLPDSIDGLKPSQRKALHVTLLSSDKASSEKVARLGALVAARTAYHHGETSMVEALVGMAQNHVGTNNINLLQPLGQFGSRLGKPKVHAAARYIETKVDPIARALFPDVDTELLQFNEDEGKRIEPKRFVPVIPFALVNGSAGIGTGWSCNLPAFNPMDLLAATRAWVAAGTEDGGDAAVEAMEMQPYYDGFTGTVTPGEDGKKYVTRGKYTCDDEVVHITELPVGVWTSEFVHYVQLSLLIEKKGSGAGEDGEKKKRKRSTLPRFVEYVENHSSDTQVDIKLHCSAPALSALAPATLDSALKMETAVSTSNMHCFDASMPPTIKKYPTPHAVLQGHARVRLQLYHVRRTHLLAALQARISILRNKRRFLQAIMDGELVLHRKSRQELKARLQADGYDPHDGGYSYLLSMPMWSTTAEKVAALDAEVGDVEGQLASLQGKTPRDLWGEDLDTFEAAYADFRARKADSLAGDGELEAPKLSGKKRKGCSSAKRRKNAKNPKGKK